MLVSGKRQDRTSLCRHTSITDTSEGQGCCEPCVAHVGVKALILFTLLALTCLGNAAVRHVMQ